MVFIARQVFSPVRYMQMVGRGLRGEKNGGTARCRIVTVVDKATFSIALSLTNSLALSLAKLFGSVRPFRPVPQV